MTTGTEFIASLPEGPGSDREQLILQAVMQNETVIEWATITSAIGDNTLEMQVSSDVLKIGTLDDCVRVAMWCSTMQYICDMLDCIMPTARISDLIWQQGVKLIPATQTPDSHMSDTSRFVQHSEAIDAQLAHLGFDSPDAIFGNLFAPEGKDFVISNRLWNNTERSANYGWQYTGAPYRGVIAGVKVWQPVGTVHVIDFTDYSQMCRLVRRKALLNGEEVDLADIYTDAKLAPLVSSEGQLKSWRHPGVPLVSDTTATSCPTLPKKEQPATVDVDKAKLPVLRRGDKGPFVKRLQERLIAHGLSLSPYGADGDFGRLSAKRVKQFQAKNNLTVDGIVGPATWAALKEEASTDEVPALVPEQRGEPSRPDFSPLVGNAARAAIFGKFSYKSAPVPGNPEAIKIGGTWVKDNIVKVTIPQLIGVRGAPKDGGIWLHKLAAPQFKAFFEEVERQGLKDRLLTFDGGWVPRFIRGSRRTLSNHCLPAEQRVWTTEGSAPIGDLKNFDGHVWSFENGVATYGKVTRFFHNGKKRLLRVRAIGHEVVCTDNHPLLVLRKRTLPKGEGIQHRTKRGAKRALYWTEMVRADEVCAGDRLVIVAQLPVKEPREDIDGDWAEILGLFIGDGCVHHRDGKPVWVSFAISTKKRTRAHAAELLARYFRKSELRQSERFLFLYRQDEFLRFLPYDKKAPEKQIPPEIWSAPASVQARFLLGYLYTDGTISHSKSSSGGGSGARFRVKAASEKLVYELRQLMAGLGFRLNRVTVEEPKDMIICGRETRSSGSWSFHAVDAHGVLCPDADPLYIERVKAASKPNTGRSHCHGYELLQPNFTHRPVRSVEWLDREADVYDIEVDRLHNFVTDGVVVSNSFGTAVDVNAQWNWLGAEPADYDEIGCLKELVPIMNEHGIYWGGFFRRRDGMHLEIAKVL